MRETKNPGAFRWCFPFLHTMRTLGMVVTALAASSWIASHTSTEGSVTSQAGQHLRPPSEYVYLNFVSTMLQQRNQVHAKKNYPMCNLGLFCLDNPRASKCHQDKVHLGRVARTATTLWYRDAGDRSSRCFEAHKVLDVASGFDAARSECMRYWCADHVQSSIHKKTANGYIQALHHQPT